MIKTCETLSQAKIIASSAKLQTFVDTTRKKIYLGKCKKIVVPKHP